MLKDFIICMVLITGFTNAKSQDSTALPKRLPTNRYTATEQIKALKTGALIVRLKTNDKSIDTYRRMGKNELADKLVAERNTMNQKIVDAFKYYFTYCPVYFIYAKNSEALVRGEQGIFLNEKMLPDTAIHLKQDFYLVAEYGSYTINERIDEYHYKGVYNTEPSNTTASTSALVMLDTTFTQLQEPFPFYSPVYLGGFIKAVNQLNANLDRFYINTLGRDDVKEQKKKKG